MVPLDPHEAGVAGERPTGAGPGSDPVSDVESFSVVRLDAMTLTDALLIRFAQLYDIRRLADDGVAPIAERPLRSEFLRHLLEKAPDPVLLFALMAGETA